MIVKRCVWLVMLGAIWIGMLGAGSCGQNALDQIDVAKKTIEEARLADAER